MKTKWYLWLIVLLLCGPTIAAEKEYAAATRQESSILIEADPLQKQLNAENVRILDVRSEDEYAERHIPGAIRVDVGDWKSLANGDGGFRDVKGWSEKLGPLGLGKNMHVVVYGSKLSDTARVWWLLKYVGVKHVSILNGGWEFWVDSGRPTETSVPRIATTEFAPEFQTDRLAEMDSLKTSLNSDDLQVVDVRSDNEFAGGRIPGAAHLEWSELVAKDGRFKTEPQLKKLFRQRGITPDETAVCY